MILNVSDALRNPGQEYRFSGEQAIAPVEIYSEQVSFDIAMIEGSYFADEDGNVTVNGNISTVAYSRCANCLGDAKSAISCPFLETFIRNGNMDDDEIFAYEGYKVSLEKMVTSYAVLELPIRFLCRPDCRGLLDEYGVSELSEQEAEGTPVQRPFAGLAGLIDENAEK